MFFVGKTFPGAVMILGGIGNHAVKIEDKSSRCRHHYLLPLAQACIEYSKRPGCQCTIGMARRSLLLAQRLIGLITSRLSRTLDQKSKCLCPMSILVMRLPTTPLRRESILLSHLPGSVHG